MKFLTVLAKSVLFGVPAEDILGTLSWITPSTVSQSAAPFPGLYCLFVFLLWPTLTPQIPPRHICRQVINVTLLHQRIIKCQVLPWQRNVMAESQWYGGGVAQVEESPGGRACWEGSMAHLTPTCPLLHQARPLTPFTHSLPGNEVVQLLWDECALPDATTCGDLLMYYKEGWWQNKELTLYSASVLYSGQNLLSKNMSKIFFIKTKQQIKVKNQKETKKAESGLKLRKPDIQGFRYFISHIPLVSFHIKQWCVKFITLILIVDLKVFWTPLVTIWSPQKMPFLFLFIQSAISNYLQQNTRVTLMSPCVSRSLTQFTLKR